MGALASAYAILKTGTLWSSTGKCKGYAVSNPGEAHQIDAYVAALDAGNVAAAPPVLTTATGRGIVGMLQALALQIPPPPVLVKPSIPTGLQASPTVSSVQLTWNANPASEQVDSYQVYGDGNALIADGLKTPAYLVTGLAAGSTHAYRVSAHNAAGYGVYTAPLTVTLPHPFAVSISGVPRIGQLLKAVIA